jgi:hypothetical protein
MRYIALAIAALCGITPAFAGAPNWAGFPGLVDADKDGYPVFVGTSTAASTGYTGAVDCDDAHASVNPGAVDIIGDGINQDCVASDAVYPVIGSIVERYRANYGKNGAPAWKPETFASEYARCSGSAGRCKPDDVDGVFRIKDPEKDAFRDIYLGSTKTLRADGVREVVTVEEASHFHGSSGSSFSGPSKATRMKEATEAAKPVVEAEAKARAEAIAQERTAREEAIEAEAKARAEAIAAERTAREEVVEDLTQKVSRAGTNAMTAFDTAVIGQRHGVLIEGYVLLGTVAGGQVKDRRDVVRSSFGMGGGAGVNFGADIAAGRVNAFADGMIGYDGGAGPGHSESVGLEVLGEKGWGGFAAYSVRSSQPNSLETQVLGRNPQLGVSYALPFADNSSGAHGLFQVRAGIGPEWLSIAGDDVTDEVGVAGRLTVGIGGGIGALLQ